MYESEIIANYNGIKMTLNFFIFKIINFFLKKKKTPV